MSVEHALEMWAQAQIDKRRRKGLERSAQIVSVEPEYHFGSNDYLALSTDPRLQHVPMQESALEDDAGPALVESTSLTSRTPKRFGASASRLVSGTTQAHIECENKIAAILEKPSALLLGSGYHANLGCLQALLQRGDLVLADRLVHASMIDGVSLSGARLRRFRHNDVDDLRTSLAAERKELSASSRIFVLTESLFSINGDIAPLAAILDVTEEYSAILILDEAHAFGVFGAQGGGIAQALGLSARVPIITGSLAKAVGTYGGFIACGEVLRDFMLGCARSFIYSTALPIPVLEASNRALDLIMTKQVQAQELFSLAEYFHVCLEEFVADLASRPEVVRLAVENEREATSYIIPFLISGNDAVVAVSRLLATHGIFAYPMRSPTVPRGHECLRFSITLHHHREALRHTAEKLAEALVAPQENL